MKTLTKIFGILLLSGFSCTNVSEADLVEEIDLTETITYTSHIKSIIDNNCISCHNNPPENGAPMSLLNYDNVTEAIENRDLIERISSNDLSEVMPFGGPRLPQNLIDLVILWQNEGLIE